MADSQTEQPRESRLSKALIGRVSAVGLFIALGTSAVLFMMDDSKKVQNLADDSASQPPAESGTAPASKTDSASGLIAAVKANFAGDELPASKAPPNSFLQGNTNQTPNSNGETNPAAKSQASFSDQAFAQKSAPPPDRFAALDKFGAPSLGAAPAQNQQAPTGTAQTGPPNFPAKLPEKNPPNNPPSFKPLMPGDNPGARKPNELGGFQPNPAQGGNVAEKTNAEVKPFTAPDLTNRLASPTDLNAPSLKAPVPNNETPNNTFKPEAPKVADNSPFDDIGKSGGNGILKPADSSLGNPNQNPNSNANSNSNAIPTNEPPRLNAAPNSVNQNQPFGNNQFANPNPVTPDNLAPRELGSPPPSNFGNPPISRPSAAQMPQTNPALGMPPNRNLGQPVSAPISAGSAINQPLNAPPRQPMSNNASGPIAAEPRTANVPGERRLDGVQAPALTVEKLSPKEITLNEVADFVIVIRNVGRVVANDVTVHDQVPANTEFQGSNPPTTQGPSDRKLQWQVGAIAPGQEKRIAYQLKPTTPGEIGSVAHVTFATQASMRTMVTNPVLEIVHRAKPVAMVGSDVIFDVLVSNKGNGPAKDVLIQEDVPPQLQYQEGYRELEYEVGTLMPGQSKRIQLPLKAVSVGRLKNSISAIATGGQKVQHEIDMEIVAPKLTVQSDGPTKRFLGRQVSHQFKVSNQGTASATNIDLVAKLPSGLRFLQTNNQGVYRRENNAVYWSMAELAPGGEATVELLSMPVEAGTQDIKFDVVSDLNQTASVAHSISIEHLVDIFFDIDDLLDPIEVGADTAYQIKVANQGTQAANNVQLQVEFPNGILPTTVEGTLQNQIAGQRVQFAPINNLKPGEQLTVVVRAKGQTAGDHRVVVTMQADGRQSAIAKEEITRVYSDR